MKHKKYQVWTESKGKEDKILMSGSYSKCKHYYMKNGASKAGLHLGYPLMVKNVSGIWEEV